jgi:hypothetical protein
MSGIDLHDRSEKAAATASIVESRDRPTPMTLVMARSRMATRTQARRRSVDGIERNIAIAREIESDTETRTKIASGRRSAPPVVIDLHHQTRSIARVIVETRRRRATRTWSESSVTRTERAVAHQRSLCRRSLLGKTCPMYSSSSSTDLGYMDALRKRSETARKQKQQRRSPSRHLLKLWILRQREQRCNRP